MFVTCFNIIVHNQPLIVVFPPGHHIHACQLAQCFFSFSILRAGPLFSITCVLLTKDIESSCFLLLMLYPKVIIMSIVVISMGNMSNSCYMEVVISKVVLKRVLYPVTILPNDHP